MGWDIFTSRPRLPCTGAQRPLLGSRVLPHGLQLLSRLAGENSFCSLANPPIPAPQCCLTQLPLTLYQCFFKRRLAGGSQASDDMYCHYDPFDSPPEMASSHSAIHHRNRRQRAHKFTGDVLPQCSAQGLPAQSHQPQPSHNSARLLTGMHGTLTGSSSSSFIEITSIKFGFYMDREKNKNNWLSSQTVS